MSEFRKLVIRRHAEIAAAKKLREELRSSWLAVDNAFKVAVTQATSDLHAAGKANHYFYWHPVERYSDALQDVIGCGTIKLSVGRPGTIDTHVSLEPDGHLPSGMVLIGHKQPHYYSFGQLHQAGCYRVLMRIWDETTALPPEYAASDERKRPNDGYVVVGPE